VAAAERAKADAEGRRSGRQAKHAAARQRVTKRLQAWEAQRDFNSAEDRSDKAKQASHAAAERVKRMRSRNAVKRAAVRRGLVCQFPDRWS
jgi:hypothetical protein